jgi:hypothetical protein
LSSRDDCVGGVQEYFKTKGCFVHAEELEGSFTDYEYFPVVSATSESSNE